MISHHHRTIFVHIPKTGGQSIESAFLRLLGLSWHERAVLLLRSNDVPSLGPPRLAHLVAADYVKCLYVTPLIFRDYFVFSFVRNPWDRVRSLYRYLGYASSLSLSAFVSGPLREAVLAQHWFVRPQSEYLVRDGVLIVDFVGRFERLQCDFDKVCAQLSLPSMSLPHMNASRGQAGADGQSLEIQGEGWSVESRDLVHELYMDDVLRFGYEPPSINVNAF